MKHFIFVGILLIFVIISFSTVDSQIQEFSQCGGSGKKLPKSCKTNKSGFLCCNDGIEGIITDAMDELKRERAAKGLKFNEFNLQALANKVGNNAEDRFNATFETVVGISNFASKTRFNGDLLCKVKAGTKFVLSYATAKKSKGSGWTARAAAAAAAAAAKDDPIIGPDEFDGNFHTYTWRDD